LFPAFSDDPFLSIHVLFISSILGVQVVKGRDDVPAIVPITTMDISSSPINPDLLVEPLIVHVHIEIRSSLSSATSSLSTKDPHCIP
jgi:hypothetical protein